MLSSVLKSKLAIQVNILIMRAFVTIRQIAFTNRELSERLNELEQKYDKQFQDAYDAINFLLKKEKQVGEQSERRKIGFKSQ